MKNTSLLILEYHINIIIYQSFYFRWTYKGLFQKLHHNETQEGKRAVGHLVLLQEKLHLYNIIIILVASQRVNLFSVGKQ